MKSSYRQSTKPNDSRATVPGGVFIPKRGDANEKVVVGSRLLGKSDDRFVLLCALSGREVTRMRSRDFWRLYHLA